MKSKNGQNVAPIGKIYLVNMFGLVKLLYRYFCGNLQQCSIIIPKQVNKLFTLIDISHHLNAFEMEIRKLWFFLFSCPV